MAISVLDFSRLRSAVGGVVITAGDPGYDAARQAWNLAIDQQPAAVVLPASVADVQAVDGVSFEVARRHRLHRELDELPEDVEAHVLPAGGTSGRDDSVFAGRDFRAVAEKIRLSREAGAAYLEAQGL